MLYFFIRKNHDFLDYGSSIYPQFDYLKRKCQHEISKVIEYFHGRDRAINNSNIFSRIISMCVDDIFASPIDILKRVEFEAPHYAKHFYLVNNNSVGTVFKNIFYTSSREVICYVTSPINLFTLQSDWKYQQPLRIVYSNNTNLDYYLLDKTKNTDSKIPEPITVVELDIPLMCLMYYFWCKERLDHGFSTNPNVFVYRYLLPNSLYSNIDITIFNRFMKITTNTKIEDARWRLPISITDTTSMIDTYLKWIDKYIGQKVMKLEEFLINFKAINNTDMSKVLWINRPVFTRQSLWSLWFSRIKYMIFLIDYIGERGAHKNRAIFTKIPVYIKALEAGSTNIFNILPIELAEDFSKDIDELKLRLGKR